MNTNSDHRLIITNINLLKSTHKKRTLRPQITRFDIRALASKNTRTNYENNLRDCIITDSPQQKTASEKLPLIQKQITCSAKETVGLLDNRKLPINCPEITALSNEQKELKMKAYNTRAPLKKAKIKAQRSQILHQINKKVKEATKLQLDEKLREIETTKDSTQMLKAVRELTRLKNNPVVIKKDNNTVTQPDQCAKIIADYFNTRLNNNGTPINNKHKTFNTG